MVVLTAHEVIGKGLEGAALLGGVSIEQAAAICMGQFDQQIQCVAAIKIQGMHKTEYVIGAAEDAFLEKIKRMVRSDLQSIFSRAEQEELKKANETMRNMNKPSEFGTINELVASTGLSKSEIRRRKADGTLEEILKEKGLI